MESKICVECGEVLTQGMKACPKCGCPVINENYYTKEAAKRKNNILPFISLVIGIVILVMGIFVITQKAHTKVFSASEYDAASAKFGADFYTEIYEVTDIIVDELNDVNNGMEIISSSINNIIDAIYFSAGMIIIALGLVTIAISCLHIKKGIS